MISERITEIKGIEIIEKFQCPKCPNKQCEDALFINENFISVIDGATSKGNLLWAGKSSGGCASQIISSTLDSLDCNASLDEFIVCCNKNINDLYNIYRLLEHVTNQPKERITGCAVVYSKQRQEIWMIGDCQFILNGVTHTNKKILDTKLAAIRSDVNNYFLKIGYSITDLQRRDFGRHIINNALKEQLFFQNSNDSNDFSYTVLDGFNIDSSNVIRVKVPDFSEIIFASDGYPKLFRTLKDSEKHLHKLLETDPLCIKENKQTKGMMLGYNSFDDRTYIRFRTL